MDSATTKFQLAIPCVLDQISPGLAALHATRAHRAHDVDVSFSPPRCPRCGASFLHGAGSIRIIRRTKTKKTQRANSTAPATQSRFNGTSRFMRYSCSVCGSDEDVPVNASNEGVLDMPQPRKRKAVDQRVQSVSSTTTLVHAEKKSKIEPPSAQPAARQAPASTPVSLATQPAVSSSPGRLSGAAAKDTPSRGKSRPKAKSGLQALLAKNREKQEKDRQQSTGGLSSFLQGL